MKHTIRLVAALALVASVGFAAQVVDFNPQNLAGAVNPAQTPSEDATTRTWAFSDTSALFAGPVAHGATLYGGARHANNTALGTSTLGLTQVYDRFQSLTAAAAGQTGTDTTILLWNKDGFLDGSAGQLAFDDTAGSRLGVTIAGVLGTLDARFVIKNSGTYYISDYSMSGATSNAVDGTSGMLWATFDPSGFDFAATSAFAVQAFTNVQSVGIAYSLSRTGAQTRLYITDFAASLVAVPMAPVSGTIVDFYYAGGNANFTRAKSVDIGGQSSWNFSETVPFGGAQAAESNSNVNVYGGLSITWDSSEAPVGLARFCSTATGDYPGGLQVTSKAGDTYDAIKGLHAWMKPDFRLAGDRFAMDTNDLLSATYATQATAGEREVRFAVKNGDTWLASESAWTGASTVTATLADPGSVEWAAVDTSDYSLGAFAPVNLSDVRAVGLYFNLKAYDPDMVQAQMRIGHFVATATAVSGDQSPGLLTAEPVQIYGSTNHATIDLLDRFYDPEDSSSLQFALVGNSNTGLVINAAVDGQMLDLTLAAGGEGNAYITIRAMDAASNTYSGPVTISVRRTGLMAWRYNHFDPAEIGNPDLESSVWGDEADPDGDGLANLVEYALALDPSVVDSGLPGMSVGNAGDSVQLYFQKSNDLSAEPDLDLYVLGSTALKSNSNWFVLNEQETLLGESGGMGFLRKTLPPAYGKLFMKLAAFRAIPLSGRNVADLAPYTTRNLYYKIADGQWLVMTLLLPTVHLHDPMPVMLYTHGGGWGGGDRFNLFNGAFNDTLRTIASNGIACAAIEYRLTTLGVSTAYDCVVDCKDAARFLVKNAAELGIDPDRIGVWGGSAGGHLSLMTALAADELFPGDPDLAGHVPDFKCVASYFPATTFLVPEILVGSNFENPNRFVSFLGGPYEDNLDLVALLSPTEHLATNSPPVLLIHGTADAVLPYTNSVYMAELGASIGADVSLITVTNGEHGLSGVDLSPTLPQVNQAAAAFLIEKLIGE